MMPRIWTETDVHIGDQLEESLAETDLAILRALALDSLKHPHAWTNVGDHQRCAFLGRGGLPITIEIGVATIDSSLAAVFFIQAKDASLSDVIAPLVRHDEFEIDDVETDYQSRSVPDQPVLKVRLGTVRRMQPMKYDPED